MCLLLVCLFFIFFCPLLCFDSLSVFKTHTHTHTYIWKWKCQLLSHVWLSVTPWTVAHQAPLSMGFSRQEYWSGLPFLPPEDLFNPGIEPASPSLQADSLPSEPPGKAIYKYICFMFHVWSFNSLRFFSSFVSLVLLFLLSMLKSLCTFMFRFLVVKSCLFDIYQWKFFEACF